MKWRKDGGSRCGTEGGDVDVIIVSAAGGSAEVHDARPLCCGLGLHVMQCAMCHMPSAMQSPVTAAVSHVRWWCTTDANTSAYRERATAALHSTVLPPLQLRSSHGTRHPARSAIHSIWTSGVRRNASCPDLDSHDLKYLKPVRPWIPGRPVWTPRAWGWAPVLTDVRNCCTGTEISASGRPPLHEPPALRPAAADRLASRRPQPSCSKGFRIAGRERKRERAERVLLVRWYCVLHSSVMARDRGYLCFGPCHVLLIARASR